jgi:hypothetical protein
MIGRNVTNINIIIIQLISYLFMCKLNRPETVNSNRNNNSIQFFIIYVPSQQLQGQLQTQQSVDTSNYIMGKHNIKSKSN